ncbi:MAG: DUF3090 family protein [Candidatus Limnocylindrales bacterium]|jgi:uncharacterized repeat protein (TIGR03847 family)
MARRVYSFENPDRFVAAAIGQPGSRTFYLQAREGSRVITVSLEKVQVAVLAERLTELLAEVRSRGADVPEEAVASEVDRAPLDEPVVETFRVGTMAIVWDVDDQSVIVEDSEVTEGEEEAEEEAAADEEEGDLVRVRLEPRRALAFASRALEVVAAGRPPCPFCGQPLNPEGHICTRRNGYMH